MNRRFIIILVFAALLAMTGCDNSMLADHPVDRDKADQTVLAAVYLLEYIAYMNQPTTTVSGRVVLCSLNNTGNPNVRINMKGRFEDKTVYTDSNGNFTINDIRPGDFVLTALRQGFAFIPPQQTVTLTASGMSNISFETMITWDRKIGGSGWEKAYSVEQTNDCGYIVAGYTDSHDIGNLDFYIIKFDIYGNIQWDQRYGGSNSEISYSVQQTSDGGYVAAGYTYSYGSGINDFWIIKLDSLGSLIWQKTFGGSEWDEARSIRQTTDNGYIVAGTTESFSLEGSDYWILKLDSGGNSVEGWVNGKTYGGAYTDEIRCIQQTQDGGFVVTGNTEVSNDGNIDINIKKINSSGDVEWSRNYDYGKNDEANDIQVTTDGGFIVTGCSGNDFGDAIILKINSSGELEWEKKYGGTYTDKAYSIKQTTDGGYIVAGYTYSSDTTDIDIYIIKLDEDGNEQWSRTFNNNESDEDIAYSIRQTADGGYVVVGSTTSYNNKKDIWIIKLNGLGVTIP